MKKEASIADFYELEFADNYGYLRLKSFDFKLVNKYEIKAKDFYTNIFEKLAENGTENFIIDLRGNTGGRTAFSAEIVPFIIQDAEDDYLKKSISWKGRTSTFKFPKKDKLAFAGQIYVLVDGLTFSTASSLARFLKEYGKAIVVGEEAGGRYEGFVGGSSEVITLPNAAIPVYIPRYHTLFPPSNKQTTEHRGLIPDMIITNSITDLKEARDRVLEHVVALCKE